MDRMTRHAKGMRRCRGAALAEAAIVMSLLMMVTLGAIEYGWLFVNIQRITNAARHGARIESRLDALPGAAETAMKVLLSDLPDTVTCSVSTASGVVTATASVPTDDVRLIHWDMLPAPPMLQATVKMAKEGNNP